MVVLSEDIFILSAEEEIRKHSFSARKEAVNDFLHVTASFKVGTEMKGGYMPFVLFSAKEERYFAEIIISLLEFNLIFILLLN